MVQRQLAVDRLPPTAADALAVEGVALPLPQLLGVRAHRSHCNVRSTKYGPSAGAVVINELEAMPEVDEIGVFGMNWHNSHSWDHTDFKYPTLVADCCSKCTIHSTPSGGYLPRGWIERPRTA